MKHLRKRQEAFCLAYIELGEATAAMVKAGYSRKWAHTNSTHIMDLPLVQARIKELRQKTEDETVMKVLERKQRLSDIGRGKGFIKPSVCVQAIDTLNKMDKIYSDGAQVNIDNRKIEVIVVSEKAKELTEAIMQGARTQLTV